METACKKPLTKNIGRIFEQAKDCKLNDTFLQNSDSDLTVLSEYFQTSKSEAFFVAIVFALNYKGEMVNFKELIDYFGCNPMRVLDYAEDFENLYKKGIFHKKKSGYLAKFLGAKDRFVIHEKVYEAILQNEAMPALEPQSPSDEISLLEQLHLLENQRSDEKISTEELFEEAEKLIATHRHFPLIERLYALKFDIKDTYLLAYLMWESLSGTEAVDLSRTLRLIYDNSSVWIGYMQKLITGKNVLINQDWVVVVESRWFNETEMKLSNRAIELLKECEILLSGKGKNTENIILPAEIPARALVFNDVEMEQLSLLKNLLKDEKLIETQNRLIQKGLPKGITVLLHGSPGTGKTETVKQWAKETNRKIMKVEISQSKSMYFGESEKIVKRIFTDYKIFADRTERTPILFFNEADAILSKRREVTDSAVRQTENTIQNILLEELENFEGILVATTNLANQLDTAFERRFLFKLAFQKPDVSTKSRIWNLKMPHLTDVECQNLASKFDFSGGQIDNIVRKCEISEIIHGKIVNFMDINSFCQDEIISDKTVKIGFCNS